MAIKPKINPGQPLCHLRIGFEDYLLPMAAAMKVAELMAKATSVDRNYSDREFVYTVKGAPSVELKTVQPDQVRMADTPMDGEIPGSGSKVRRLGQQALALPMPKAR